jgi:hypothetical protein
MGPDRGDDEGQQDRCRPGEETMVRRPQEEEFYESNHPRQFPKNLAMP